jgi:hypothetical protein
LASDGRLARGLDALFAVTDPEDARFADLVVDTGRDTIDESVASIAVLAIAPRFQATPDSRAELKTRALRLSAKAAPCGTQAVAPDSRQEQHARSWFDAWPALEPAVSANHGARIAWLT